MEDQIWLKKPTDWDGVTGTKASDQLPQSEQQEDRAFDLSWSLQCSGFFCMYKVGEGKGKAIGSVFIVFFVVKFCNSLQFLAHSHLSMSF